MKNFIIAVLIIVINLEGSHYEQAESNLKPLSISTTPVWIGESSEIETGFGKALTSGDINGDGFSDFVVGDPYFSNGNTNEGAVFIYYGTPYGLNSLPSCTIESNYTNALFGFSIDASEDFDNDGYDDLLVGAPDFDVDGRVFIYKGSVTGIKDSIAWINGFIGNGSKFGASVSYAGDVDKNHFIDIIVGDPDYSNGQGNEGRVYIYYNYSTGLSVSPNWYEESDNVYGFYGNAVSSAGDVNNDGYDDVVVSEYGFNDYQGIIFVYNGSSSGVATSASWYYKPSPSYTKFGFALSGKGDLNNDGYDDFIVGAPEYSNGQTKEGRVYLFYGSATGISSNDILESNQSAAGFGYSLSILGDLNKDNCDDIIVGAPFYDSIYSDLGKSYLFLCADTGVLINPVWTSIGENNENKYSLCVSGVGDINGDGFEEIVVADPSYDDSSSGYSYVYLYSNLSEYLPDFNLISPKNIINNNLPTYIWEKPVSDKLKEYSLYIDNQRITSLDDTQFVSITPLEDGNYDWYVIAKDSLNQIKYSEQTDTFIVDCTKPSIPNLNPIDNSYLKNNILIFKSTDNLTGIKNYQVIVSEDSFLGEPMNFNVEDTFVIVALDEITYFWKVMATDSALNGGNWTEVASFTYDKTCPTQFDLISPNGAFNLINTPTYVWHKANDLRFKEYKLYVNGSLKVALPDTFFTEPSGIADGQYIWYVTAGDSAENITQSISTDTMILDVTKPSKVVLISPVNLSILSGVPTFVWYKAIDSYSGIKNYELQYDEDTLFGSPTILIRTDTIFTPATLADGRYYWRVRAVDNCNNSSDWSTKRTFLYDASAPTPFSLISPSGYTVDNTPTYLWHKSNDNLFKEYRLYVNGSLRTTLTDTIFTETSTKSDGVYEWYVIAYDSLNNSTSSNDKDTLIIDITVPARVTLINPANGWYSKTNQLIWAKASDSLSGVKNYNLLYSADSLFVSAETLTVLDTTYSPSLDMIKYYWKVRAIDNCGNKGLWSTRWSFTFDTLSPTIFNLISPDGINNSDNTPLYIWNKTEDSYFRYYRLYVNGALKATVTDTSFLETLNLTDGQYIWSVDAYDYAGNIRQCLKPDTMKLDITKPLIPSLLSPENNGFASSALFTWHRSTDNYSGIYNYELMHSNDSLFGIYQSASCVDTFYSTSLTDQIYYWRVRAIDNFDNIGDWSTTWSFEFDGTIPASPNLIFPIQNEEVSDSIVLFDWDVVMKSSSEEQDVEGNTTKSTQIHYIINVDTTKIFSSPIFEDTVTIDSTSFLINMGGKYYWKVKAYDEALNQGNWSSIDSFELDVTKPTIPNKISPINGIANNDAIFIWHKASDNYSGIKEYSLWLDIDSLFSSPDTFILSDTTCASLLNEQEYYWKVRATDNFDNIGNWSTTWNFEFDSTIPATPILVSPLNNSTTASNIFTWNKATDNYTGIKHYNLWFDDDSLFSSPDTITTTDTSYTVALGDYTYYWMVRAIDNADNTGNWSSVWSFDFSPAGITDKFTLETKEKSNTELTVTMNHVRFAMMTSENEFTVYDITGKVVHSELNSRTGKHTYSTEHLSSGIYFIRFKDGARDMNRKMVIIR